MSYPEDPRVLTDSDKTFRTVLRGVSFNYEIQLTATRDHMTERLRYHPFRYQFFNQCPNFVALLFTGNLNQRLDYVDLLFSTNLYTKTLQTWNTWMLTASLMWIAILPPNLTWRWRITESATILYVTECRLSITSYCNPLLIFLSPSLRLRAHRAGRCVTDASARSEDYVRQ